MEKKKVSRNISRPKKNRPDKVKRPSRAGKLNSAVLFSGGKDSGLALFYALQHTHVKCLIIMQSENQESYMFHTPNIRWAKMQAERTGIPYLIKKTHGEKEKELDDLADAIIDAKKRFHVSAIVTGAIESVYQASRVQAITNSLGIECFNPLWQKDQISILKDIIEKKFSIIIVGVFGYGLDGLIGRIIDERFIDDVARLNETLKINPAGEGGEYESFILDAPYYSKPLKIDSKRIIKDSSGGIVLDIQGMV